MAEEAQTSKIVYTTGQKWSERTFRTKAAYVIGSVWTLYILCVIFRLFFYMDIIIYPMTHRAFCAGALTVMALLALPAKRNASLTVLNWWECFLVISVIVATSYIAINAGVLQSKWGDATWWQMIMALCFSLGVMEAVRRTSGSAPVILAILAFFYFVYSDHFPGFMMSMGFSYSNATGWMFLSGEGFWGSIVGVAATIVPGFILFGSILRSTGASSFFSDLATACMGHYRGGPAKTAVLSSMLFGSLSGSVAANVATTGQITIPLMKKNGFSAELAGAIESVASTGGLFTPPIMGATAFLIADFLGISYWKVCVGAFLPALLFYATLLYQVDIEAIRHGSKGEAKEKLPKVKDVLLKGWYYLPPFAVLIFCMGFLKYSAESSIVYTILSLILFTSLSKEYRMSFKKFLVVLEDTAQGMYMVIPLCVVIGILVGSLTITGAGNNLSTELSDIAGNNIYVMLAVAGIASFFIGMGMASIACYLITVLMLAPAIVGSGVEPLSVHLFLSYYGTLSFITPPVAIAAFVASSISGGDPNKTGLLSVRMGIAGFLVPWAFVMHPELLFMGTLPKIILVFIMCFIGLGLISSALAGYLFVHLNIAYRLVCLILGILLFLPIAPIYQYIALAFCVCSITSFYFYSQKVNQLT